MKIIILGAGQVGTSVAANLVSEANDITVVDHNPELLRELQERFDLRTVLGHGAHPDVLARAGADDADMIIAVTNSDETNMVACQVAYTLFHTPTKIARVRAQSFLDQPRLFGTDALPIDVAISPEALVTSYILRLIENPGTLQVLDFAGGRIRLVAVKAYYGGPLVGHELRALQEHMPQVDARVAAIYRQDRAIQPEGDTVIEADDEVFFLAAPIHIRAVMGELRRLDKSYKRLIVAGGGNIGTRLARALEANYRVKLIERNLNHCKRIAEDLEKTIVLHGDAADQELLLEENIENTDVFCAVTNDDEAKILSAMLAKRLGAHEIGRLIHPNAQLPVRIGGKSVNHRVVDAVWGFFSLYVASFVLMYLLLAATGLDLLTAFSAVAACINNLGPGLAQVGAHYADLHDLAKWILCFAMLLGRLEIFTLLVLLSPAFWQR
ncbi:Trk system potassium transporter TrkA [Thiocystis violascens]|uniref:Trk system potassium uptake protein TrkA n=1 Tax=Thiocystis violascens (strain ATCC 17096 / DSM 198 / 6111) TaxID=765911 RepID=I3YDK1_THIV6|nr:Trk system potassium transporter TrkA [Thiocystis violascens]AFL75069.1 K+ transport system, NAD-binding component [Thiocystis violascens DSM 198]